MNRHIIVIAAIGTTALGAACGSSSNTCNPTAANACSGGQACEAVVGGQPRCFDPVVLTGTVFDLALGKASGGIASARVVALDVNNAPVGSAATSAAGGAYSLQVPTTRDGAGKPVSSQVTLRADAAGFATFPSGIRVAVPLDLSGAVHGGGKWTLASSLTDIGLSAAAGGTGRIHGTAAFNSGGARVVAGGVLVVAEPAAGGSGHTAVADASGEYVIFNVPAGDWNVKAYAKGANYAPASAAALASGEDRLVDLSIANTATATVTGTLQPVGSNQPASLDTSVILVVRSTYDPAIDRGEAPPGLIVSNLTTPGWSLAGVPDGEYTVLAAFGNDGYVRDLSLIGGTAPVDVTVVGGAMTSAPGTFKITGAVSLAATDPITPTSGTEGSVTIVTGATPTFTWQAYPATHSYQIDVFDAFGNSIWQTSFPFSTTQVAYGGGTALASGMTYQVRITAFDTGGAQISRTEDLMGIFTYRP